MTRVEIVPLRPWNDFFPGSERFAKPDFTDLAKWNNRLVSNLLYYQTNYLIMAIVVFLVVGFLNPMSMVLGGTVVILVFLGSVWASENKAIIKDFKKKNPAIFVITMMVTSFFLISLMGGVMVFFFGITFPLLLIILHASLRLRNVKNKLENRIEGAGLKTSPMGIVLQALGQQGDNLNKIQDFLENRLKE